jgi:hypothetical protein
VIITVADIGVRDLTRAVALSIVDGQQLLDHFEDISQLGRVQGGARQHTRVLLTVLEGDDARKTLVSQVSVFSLRSIESHASLTVKLASRYIIRSLRCLIGEAVSPVAVEFCAGLGALTTPLEVAGLVCRWVRGLVPCVHAVLAGGFLRVAKSALRQVQVRAGLEERVVRYELMGESTRGEGYLLDSQVAPCLHVTARTSHENIPHCGSGVQRALEACLRRNLQAQKLSSPKQKDATLDVCVGMYCGA